MRWAEISIQADRDALDIASDVLMNEGCAGTLERQSDDAEAGYAMCSVRLPAC